MYLLHNSGFYKTGQIEDKWTIAMKMRLLIYYINWIKIFINYFIIYSSFILQLNTDFYNDVLICLLHYSTKVTVIK